MLSLAPTLEMDPGLLSLASAALSGPVFSPKSPVLKVEVTSSTLAGHRSTKQSLSQVPLQGPLQN